MARPDQLLNSQGDGLHGNLAVDNGELTQSVDFDYAEVSRALGEEREAEEQVDFSDATSAVKSILLWICPPPSPVLAGARAAALLCWLDPVEAKTRDRDSLTKIARLAGVTKSAASRWLVELRDALGLQVGMGKSQMSRKWVVDFRDQVGTSLTVGKKSSKRGVFRNAQITALENGTHSSFKRKSHHSQQ
jgi:hypothetical protein